MPQQLMEVDISQVLNALKSKAPQELHSFFSVFEDLYERKLYHQLTLKVKEFVLIPASKPLLLPLYEKFISLWEKTMNKSFLVQIILVTARQYSDHKDAIACLDSISKKVFEENKEAFVLARMESAYYKLILNDPQGTKSIIEECDKILSEISSSVDPIVYAKFYSVSADYFKAKADYANYYKNALLFLACCGNINDLSPTESHDRAYDLSVSALLADSLYNFGELLMHPVLDSLTGTANEWLRSLLFAFNSGDMPKFDHLSAAHFSKLPLLAQNISFLRQKLCIMTLVELIFKSPSSDRKKLSFNLIAKETRLPLEEVEILLMKALALNIIKGRIDQVEQIISIEWVQPRILDKSQVHVMSQRVGEWKSKVAALVEQVKA